MGFPRSVLGPAPRDTWERQAAGETNEDTKKASRSPEMPGRHQLPVCRGTQGNLAAPAKRASSPRCTATGILPDSVSKAQRQREVATQTGICTQLQLRQQHEVRVARRKGHSTWRSAPSTRVSTQGRAPAAWSHTCCLHLSQVPRLRMAAVGILL